MRIARPTYLQPPLRSPGATFLADTAARKICGDAGPERTPRYFLAVAIAACFLARGGAAAAGELARPDLFAPGVISELVADSSPSFFPEDREVVFEHADLQRSELRISQRTGDGWTKPTTAAFSGRWWDLEPAVSADGRYVIFVSARPSTTGGAQIDGHWAGASMWGGAETSGASTGVQEGWGTPVRLDDRINANDAVFAPSLAADGTLYFERVDPSTGRFKLFRALSRRGDYGPAEGLRFFADGVTESDPAVAPDQSFLVFISDYCAPDRMQLFIALRSGSGWAKPILLPNAVNGHANNSDPHLNSDGSILYFSHDRVIWHTPMEPLVDWARTNRSEANTGQCPEAP